MAKQPDHPRRVLGKGLSALLPQKTPAPVSTPPVETAPATDGRPPAAAVLQVPIDHIEPNPLQPRSVFQPERLQELAQSIAANGIIQPLVVQHRDHRYQLVAGERRWRAAKLAGLAEVPVVVQNFADDRLMEIALIENIQREDLNPIEVAHAFERLAQEHNLSHEQIGERTGKDRSTVTNMLRLLRLPQEVQLLVAEQRLSMGHARAILALPDEHAQLSVAQRAAGEGMSVRQVERMVQRALTPHPPADDAEQPRIDPNVKAAIQQLEQVLGTRVKIIEKTAHKGRIEIEYYSQEDLDRIYTAIVGDSQAG